MEYLQAKSEGVGDMAWVLVIAAQQAGGGSHLALLIVIVKKKNLLTGELRIVVFLLELIVPNVKKLQKSVYEKKQLFVALGINLAVLFKSKGVLNLALRGEIPATLTAAASHPMS